MSCKYEKIKNLKVKNGVICNLKVKNLEAENGTFQNLDVENLNVSKLNGLDISCLSSHNNVSGVITPVIYVNGQPQQPANDGTFNQLLLDELWQLNQLSVSVTNLDAAYGRLKNNILSKFYGCEICPPEELNNCNCPISTYSVFNGSIDGNVLTVSLMLNTSYTDCPANVGTIRVGQYVYGKSNSFLSSVIVNQLSGVPGGVGTYTIQNDFDNYMEIVPEQEMLSISNLGIEECAAVPLRIYGVETLSVGPTGDCRSVIDTLTYNLNIANKTLSSRLAAVYVQIGYVNSIDEVIIQGLVIDTRQFDPSILSFGEQMNNAILIDSDLVQFVSKFNQGGIINAVLQLAVYVEDGLKVLIPNGNDSSFAENVKVLQNATVSSPNTNYSVSFSTIVYCAERYTGTVSTFAQPPVGQTVTVTYSGFGNSSVSFPMNNPGNSVFVSQGGWYVVSSSAGSFPPQTVLINLGYTGNASPGTLISSTPMNGIVQGYFGLLQNSFVQPALGSNVTANFSISPTCVGSLVNQTVYIAAGNLYGVYKVISYQLIDSSNLPIYGIYAIVLQNVGIPAFPNPSITNPGTTILNTPFTGLFVLDFV